MTSSDDTTFSYTLPTGEVVFVDENDADLLADYRWAKNGGYAYHKLPKIMGGKSSYLHREILERMIDWLRAKSATTPI